jgi:hypothetical protein
MPPSRTSSRVLARVTVQFVVQRLDGDPQFFGGGGLVALVPLEGRLKPLRVGAEKTWLAKPFELLDDDDRHLIFDTPWRNTHGLPEDIEVEDAFMLGRDRIRGRYDRIDLGDDGYVTITDYKSSDVRDPVDVLPTVVVPRQDADLLGRGVEAQLTGRVAVPEAGHANPEQPHSGAFEPQAREQLACGREHLLRAVGRCRQRP